MIEAGSLELRQDNRVQRVLAPAACLLPPMDAAELRCSAATVWGELLFQLVHAKREQRSPGAWIHLAGPQPLAPAIFGFELPRLVPEELLEEAVATVAIAGGMYFHDELSHAEANALLHRFIIRLAQAASSQTPVLDPIQQAETFAAKQIDTGCTVADMAQAVGLSAGRLTSLWRAQRGETPGTCLDRLRLAQACRALQSGRSVELCAQMCGYRSPTSFSAWFKRQVGMPPSKWQRQHALVKRRTTR